LVLLFQDLSDIVARLDSIENKLDLVIKQAKSAKYSTLRVETSSPIPKKEVSLNSRGQLHTNITPKSLITDY